MRTPLRKAFTLAEIIVVMSVSSIVLLIVSLSVPAFFENLEAQKDTLDFQKDALIDTSYLFERATRSKRFLPELSFSGSSSSNAAAVFLDRFRKDGLPLFYVSTFTSTGMSSTGTTTRSYVWAKDLVPYAWFAKVGAYVYAASPADGSILRIDASANVTVFSTGYSLPTGLATDGTDLFVAESGKNAITKLVVASTSRSLLLGSSGSYGYNHGETDVSGTPASSVLLNNPTGLAYSTGSLWISDTNNNRIRRYDIAQAKAFTPIGTGKPGSAPDYGSAALSSPLRYPVGCAVLSTGSQNGLVFAEAWNGKVRYFDFTTSKLTTLAGLDSVLNAKAPASSPSMALPFVTSVQFASGSVYFNDFSNGIAFRVLPGSDTLFGNADDTVAQLFGKSTDTLLANPGFELPFSDPSNDISFSGSNSSILSRVSSGSWKMPFEGDYSLAVDSRGLSATGELTFVSNPSDGATLDIAGYGYEFDDGTLVVWSGRILVPLSATLSGTLDNLVTELKRNTMVGTILSGSKLAFVSKSYGDSGNSLPFTTTSPSISLAPGSGHFSGGSAFSWALTTDFWITKNLVSGKKYALSFRLASPDTISTSVSAPLLTIDFGTGSPSGTLTSDPNWKYYVYPFLGNGPSQSVRFSIRNGYKAQFDSLSIVPLESREADGSLQTFRADILPSYYYDSPSSRYFVFDYVNKKLKMLDMTAKTVTTLQTWVGFFDPKLFRLGAFPGDFSGKASIDRFWFASQSFASLLSSKIEFLLERESGIVRVMLNVSWNVSN